MEENNSPDNGFRPDINDGSAAAGSPQPEADAQAPRAEIYSEPKEEEQKILGSRKLYDFFGNKVREGSWMSWGLLLLLAFALYAITRIVVVILYFTR